VKSFMALALAMGALPPASAPEAAPPARGEQPLRQKDRFASDLGRRYLPTQRRRWAQRDREYAEYKIAKAAEKRARREERNRKLAGDADE
jgi:hypothetical protein